MRKPKTAEKSTGKVGIKVLTSMNLGFYGPEPIYDRKMTDKEFSDAVSWYNYNIDDKDGTQFVAQYLVSQNRDDEAALVKKYGTKYFPSSMGRIARILLTGGTPPDYAMVNFEQALKDGLNHLQASQKDAPVTIYKDEPRVNERNVALVETIQEAYEALSRKFEVKEFLADQPAYLIEKIGDWFKTDLDELMTWSPDDDISEKQLGKMKVYLTNLVVDIYSLIGKDPFAAPEVVIKVKKPRKPRKKKVIPPEKQVAKVKIAMEYPDLGLKGIEPKDMIGKQGVWIYDTRYSKLTHLAAASETGLTVKGSTIINFDEETSESKRVGRKAKDVTNEVVNGGKVALRHVFDNIKSQNIKFTGRLSANNIILRIDK